jgi:hypothetical protein
MWRNGPAEHRIDFHRCVFVVNGTTHMQALYSQNVDCWTLTADAVSCWSINASGVVACNDYDFRLRAINDSNHRIWYNSGIDGVEVYGNNRVRLASGGAARIDAGNGGIYFYIVPGGSDADTILRIAGSQQVLKHTSSIKAKTSVQTLDRKGDGNPIWDMRAVTFKWNNRPPEELERLDRLRPGGRSVGFIAEEIHAVSPDCTTFNVDDEPDGLNETGILAYTVAGLQYMRSLVEDLRAEVKSLRDANKKEM